MMMFIWVVLPVVMCLLAIWYLYRKIYSGLRFFANKPTEISSRQILKNGSHKEQSKTRNKKWKYRLASGATVLLLIVPVIWIGSMWILVLLHLTGILLIIDIIVLLLRLIFKRTSFYKNNQCPRWLKGIYRSGIVAVLLTVAIMIYGRYNIFHVIQTDYTVQTDKDIRAEGYKILLLSDLHYGITLNHVQLKDVVARMNQENPDIVILDGDIVDESTTKAQMQEAFETLGQLKNTYGIYYVYGNHDQNNYAADPNYDKAQLDEVITQAGITILEDETAIINDEIALIGRKDRGDGADDGVRESISNLTGTLDSQMEWIVLDHQPADYAAVQKAGCDMILSGHTHAGQIWPAGQFSDLFHLNELGYGEKTINQLDAIVTSGIAGWGFPMRTEKHSEYLMINLTSSN